MGTLFIVATPIGNLKDITFRAVETLSMADYILCEDTRVTSKLLKTYNLSKRMVTLNDFNEEKQLSTVIDDLTAGGTIALVSDAGTPLISDPGFKVVREAVRRNIKVVSIPGPSALTGAISVSAMPTDKFLFVGFLPKKEGKQKEILLKILKARKELNFTVVIYESPYRVKKTLNAILEVFGDVEVSIVRELTKLHEEIVKNNISQIKDSIIEKGEFVILF